MLEILFWSSIIFIAYTYFGYLLLLKLISLFRSKSIQKAAITPFVTLIITAHNEQERITAKLDNTLSLDYPEDRLQIIVASDCSTDETDNIVKTFESKDITLVKSSERRDKEYAQKLAVEQARGWLIPFALVLVFVTNALLADQSLEYTCFLVLQIAFYVAALAGFANKSLASRNLFRVPLYFATTNLSILIAWFMYFSGDRFVLWEPSWR